MKNRIAGRWIAAGIVVGWMAGCANYREQPQHATMAEERAGLASVVTFLEQPRGFTNKIGSDNKLQVSVADGKNFQYQWLRNGSPLVGSNLPVLPRDNFQAADGGSYSVMVFRRDGMGAISEVAKVRTVLPTLGLGNSFAQRARSKEPSGLFQDNNEKASAERLEPDHAEQAPAKSLWLQWTAPGRGVVTFDTRGSGFDTRLAAYELKGRSETPDDQLRITALDPEAVTYDDDRGADLTSLLYFNTQPGQRYFIAVDGKAVSSFIPPAGNIVLRWQWRQSDPVPVVKKQPADASAEVGPGWRKAAEFTVTMQEPGDYEFNWFRLGSEKVLFTERSNRASKFALPNASEKDVGVYFARITDRKFKAPPVDSRQAMLSFTSFLDADAGANPNPGQPPPPMLFAAAAATTSGNFGSSTVPLSGPTPFGYTCSGGTFDRYVRMPKLFTGRTNGISSVVFSNTNKTRVLITTTNCLNSGVDTALQLSMVAPPFNVVRCSNNFAPVVCSAGPAPTALTLMPCGLTSNTHYNALIFFRNSTTNGHVNIRANWRYQ